MKLFSTLILTGLLSLQAFANKEHKVNKGERFRKMIQELNLSEDQITKIKEHRKTSRSQVKELKSQMKELKEKMKISFISDSDSSELVALSSKMDTVRDQLGKIKFSKMLLFKSLLDKSQRVKFMELRPKRKKRR